MRFTHEQHAEKMLNPPAPRFAIFVSGQRVELPQYTQAELAWKRISAALDKWNAEHGRLKAAKT